MIRHKQEERPNERLSSHTLEKIDMPDSQSPNQQPSRNIHQTTNSQSVTPGQNGLLSSSSIKHNLASSSRSPQQHLSLTNVANSSKKKISFIHEKFMEKEQIIATQEKVIQDLRKQLDQIKQHHIPIMVASKNQQLSRSRWQQVSQATQLQQIRKQSTKDIRSRESMIPPASPIAPFAINSHNNLTSTESQFHKKVEQLQQQFASFKLAQQQKQHSFEADYSSQSVYVAKLFRNYEEIKVQYDELYNNFRRLHLQHMSVTAELESFKKRNQALEDQVRQFDVLESSLRTIIRSKDYDIRSMTDKSHSYYRRETFSSTQIQPQCGINTSSSNSYSQSSATLISRLQSKIELLSFKLNAKEYENSCLKEKYQTLERQVKAGGSREMIPQSQEKRIRATSSSHESKERKVNNNSIGSFIKIEQAPKICRKTGPKQSKSNSNILNIRLPGGKFANHNSEQEELQNGGYQPQIVISPKNQAVNIRCRSPTTIVQTVRKHRSPTLKTNIK